MKFTIFGERCSGTNWLEHILLSNFKIDVTWEAGFKHWFGYKNHDKVVQQHQDLIYFCIVRNPFDYLMSSYDHKHHQSSERTTSIEAFLLSEFYSIEDDGKEKLDLFIFPDVFVDRKNDGNRYKNIFGMRSEKCKFLFEKMPNLVKNYFFIRYEDLKLDPKKTLKDISNRFNFIQKNSQIYIEEKYVYKKGMTTKIKNIPCKENYEIDDYIKKIIIENLDKKIEYKMGYIY